MSERSGEKAIRRVRGWRGPERGAAVVEFALVLPLLAVLLFGIIDFGVVYSDHLAVRSGTRDGARQGAVGVVGGDASCSTLTETGDPGWAQTNKLICLTKTRIGADASTVRVKVGFGTGGDVKGEPMVVCAIAPVQSSTGVFTPFLSGRWTTAKVQTRVETEGSPRLVSAQEEDPSGRAWSWCNVTPVS